MLTYTPNHRQRSKALAIQMLLLCVGVGLILYSLSENISVYTLPSVLLAGKDVCSKSPCRLGAIVKKGSVHIQDNDIHFLAADPKEDVSIAVEFQGVLPSLFKEDTMMLAEGKMQAGVFKATRILAKHDENYQPPI